MAVIRIQGESDGSMSAEIPDFALDSTVTMLANATGVSNQILKSIAKATGVSQMELNKLSTAVKQQTVVQSKKTDDLTAATNRQTKAVIDGNQITAGVGRDIGSVYKAINSNTRTLEGVMTPIAQGLGNLVSGLAGAIPGLGGLAKSVTQAGVAVTGFMAGSTDEFIKQAQTLSKNIGFVSGDQGLMKLRKAAAEAGLFMGDLSAAAEQGGTAIAALADQSNGFRSGLIQFAKMSDELAVMTKKFGDFGFSVSELNELMVDEMSLRRQRGASDDEIREKTNASLTYMLRETTALADLTGRNRRDMIRSSFEVRSDVVGRQRLAGMSDEERRAAEASQQRIFAALGPEIGAQIVNAANQAAVTGFDIMQLLPPELVSAFQQSQGALRNITDAYLAGDQEALSTELLPKLLEVIESRQRTINEQAMGRGIGAPGANALLEMQTQMNQTADNIANAEVRSQQLGDMTREMGLMLTPRQLQQFATEVATMGQNLTFGEGGPEAFAGFVQDALQKVRGATGVDNIGRTELSPTQIAALGAFFANSAAVGGAQPAEGGGGGPGLLESAAAGAVGGAATRGGAVRMAVGLAGSALRFIGPLGAFIFAGAAVAAIGKGISNLMDRKQQEEDIRKFGGAAIGEATDQLRIMMGDVFGEDFDMADIITETAKKLESQGLSAKDLSQGQLAQELQNSAMSLLQENTKQILSGGAGFDANQITRRLEYADALAQGETGQLGTSFWSLDTFDATGSSFNDLTSQFAKNADLLQNILNPANAGLFDQATKDRALKEVAVLKAQVEGVQTALNANKFGDEDAEAARAMMDKVLPGLTAISDMVDVDRGIFSNQSISEGIAGALQSVTLDSDAFAAAGITDEKTQRMLLALENALEDNVVGQIDNVDLAVSSAMTAGIAGTNIENLNQLNSGEVVRLLQQIAESAGISATSDVAIFEANRVKELRERSDNINN